jgi:hypothetical protein
VTSRFVIGLLILAGPRAVVAQGRDSAAVRFARVTYLTATTAYLNAGREDGLSDSLRLEVRRQGVRIGSVRVAFLSSHRAACDILDTVRTLAVGDSVSFVPRMPRPLAVAGPPAARAPYRPQVRTVRGTVGLEYLSVVNRDGSGVRFSQPGLQVRLGGGSAGSPLSFGLDVRTRRITYADPSRSGTVTDESRVYQAVARWQAPGSAGRLALGRQFVDGIPAVGLIDGLQLTTDHPAWAAGVFAGTAPGVTNLQLSGTTRVFGGFVRRQGRAAGWGSWALTAGATGSYEGWRTNREFLYLEARYFGPRMSGFLSQEVDYYRPWKRLAGEHAFSPTSTFGQLRYQFGDAWSVQGGVDERRNVRLFADAATPESTFDAAFRRGAWAGTTLRPEAHVLVDLDVRASDGGSIGRTDSYTATVAVERLGSLGAGVRLRGTQYVSPGRTGWLAAVSAGVAPADRWRLNLNAGGRQESLAIQSGWQSIYWVGADADWSVGRAWLATLSVNRQRGGQESADQVFVWLAYRF